MAWYSKLFANLKRYGPAIVEAIIAFKKKK